MLAPIRIDNPIITLKSRIENSIPLASSLSSGTSSCQEGAEEAGVV